MSLFHVSLELFQLQMAEGTDKLVVALVAYLVTDGDWGCKMANFEFH